MLKHKKDHQSLLLSIDSKVLDISNAHELRAAIKHLPAGPFTKIVIDFSDVEFLDSSGLGVLLTLYKQYPADGAKQRPAIIIQNSRLEVANVFHLFRLTRVFTLMDDAMAS
ncbi:MAG: STAS domain-containing protein [Verrucomicrobiota bacterium]|nr:STAS domain-containing protein [Verrucomicrobiota bacterium]